MSSIPFIDCIEIVGSSVKEFEGSKKYINTGAINVNSIDLSQAENITFLDKPSRANLLADEGDLLFAKMQSTNKTVIIDQQSADYIFSTGFFAVRAKERVITKRCLYHLLKSDLFLIQKDKYCSGATQKAITNTGLKKIIVNIPPVEMQNGIANNFDQIDCLINLCSITLEKLDTLVKSRFVEMFGDIVYNTKQWKTYVFSEIATSRLGKMLDTKKQTGNYSFPYLANYNVQWFRFELDNLNQMDFNEKDQVEFALEEGDLLVCEGGEIGRCAIWHNEVSPCFFQKALHRVRCKKDIIIPDYLAWWFRFNCDNNGFSEIEGAKATIAHLPGAKLKKLNVVVPPLDLQKQFADFVAQTDKSKLAVQKSIEKLEILKKSLMQEYFG